MPVASGRCWRSAIKKLTQMTSLRKWMQMRWKQTKIGTILASIHCVFVSVIIAGISISPSQDWPWWTLFPFLADLPFSFVIKFLLDNFRDSIVLLPHFGLEHWLLNQREPFCSLDLFWLPAILFLILGTMWHYYWPLLLKIIFQRLFRSLKKIPAKD